MIFVKTFKGYEDKPAQLDDDVNQWVVTHGGKVEIVDIKTCMSHEEASRARSGDLIYTVLYRAGEPLN
jgi:hypothetical protein